MRITLFYIEALKLLTLVLGYLLMKWYLQYTQIFTGYIMIKHYCLHVWQNNNYCNIITGWLY